VIKAELKKLRTLKATPKMMELAKNDKKKKRTITTHYGYQYEKVSYEYALFLRCQTLKGYLKVAVFFPEHMRCGSNMPAYEIFLHRSAEQYLTWDAQNQKWLTAMAYNLPCMWLHDNANYWINPEGAATIKRYLGVEKTGLDGVIQWQQKMHKQQVERKYKRMTDPWDADQALVPKLPGDWEAWLRQCAVREWFVFYETGKNTGWCTYCGKDVPIAEAKHNKKTVCTCCGNNVTYKNTNRLKYLDTRCYSAQLMQKVREGLVVRSFRVNIGYRKDEGWVPKIRDSEIRRAFYDKEAKHRASYSYEWFRNREMRFCKAQPYYIGYGASADGAIYTKTLPTLYKSVLQHTGMAEIRKKGYRINLEGYLTVYNRYPQIELLAKAGLPALTRDCIITSSALDEVINPGIEGSLAKKMHIDESRLKRLRAMDGGLKALRWLRHEKKTEQLIPDEIIKWLDKSCFLPQNFSFIKERMRLVQIYNYIQKQMELSEADAGTVLTWWRDTLSMEERDGKNMSDPYFYRPARLKARHDELVLKSAMKDLKATAEKSRKKFPKVEPVLQEVKEVYSYTGEKYMVVVPTQILQIVMEGRALNHCVGTSERYMERIENRESYIFFLRKTDAPEESYYTLEVEPDGTVRQKRTTNDEQRPDIEDAKKFLKKWQKEIAKRLTDTERDLAKKSKQLRMEGFEQMRRDHVRIHTGKLQGRLLVDVLMADLMENEEEKTA